MSIEVRNWIAWNMNPILVRMIVKGQPRAELADEFHGESVTLHDTSSKLPGIRKVTTLALNELE
jgi:hypothetical protein